MAVHPPHGALGIRPLCPTRPPQHSHKVLLVSTGKPKESKSCKKTLLRPKPQAPCSKNCKKTRRRLERQLQRRLGRQRPTQQAPCCEDWNGSGRMSRHLKAQPRTAEDNWQAEAPFGADLYGADLYGADQQQRTKSRH